MLTNAPKQADRFVHTNVAVLGTDAACTSVLRSLLGPRGTVTVARSIAEAASLLRATDCHGLVTDLSLPDGSGLDVLAHWRGHNPRKPGLVISSSTRREDINAAQRINVRYLVKPIDTLDLEPFIASITSSLYLLEHVVHALSRRHGLSQTETDVVLAAAHGETRDAIAARRRCSPLTIRAHVASILKRTGHASLRDLIECLLREAADVRAA